MKKIVNGVLLIGAVLGLCGAASAGFSGQTILGPIGAGDSVGGDTTGASDDNDGWYSGDHVFDIWDGGDDVWSLNWLGGDLTINVSYPDPSPVDIDLFLYVPGSYDESSYDSLTNTGFETITVADAPAGKYYILLDSTAGTEGAYTLEVPQVPAPGPMALVTGAGLVGVSRRRR
ncbi:MAG TPA: hypothetical protein VG797_02765 [Phycisphaerales bacterium]|nr:hypothetical protein [Phycisphaerales bacterium]